VLRKPGLKLDEVFNQVRENVYTASGSKQLAWSSSSVIGDFYFLPVGSSPPEKRDLTLVADAQRPPATVQVANPPRQAAAAVDDSSLRDALDDRLTKLVARAGAVTGSLDNLRQEQARQGVSLRGDMAAASTQLNVLLNQAEKAFNDGDLRRASRSMDQLEPVLAKLERFLGM
jgi:hypothetical protein